MRTVLVTGCSSGVGLEAALAFARRGDAVIATMRDLAKSERLDERAAGAKVELDVRALDVTVDASVAAAIDEIERDHGRIDVVVNNAGVGFPGPVETFGVDRARILMETKDAP